VSATRIPSRRERRLSAGIADSLLPRQKEPCTRWSVALAERGSNISGFRGATCIPNPSGSGEPLLLALEDSPSIISRVNPQDHFSEVQELNVSSFLSSPWHARVTYAIVAHNSMVPYPNTAAPPCPSLMRGLEAVTHRTVDAVTSGRA